MSKKNLAILAFALAASQVGGAAHAESKTWYFSYQGFQHSYFDGPEWEEPPPFVWEKDARFNGQFIAEDVNRDSVISRDEVTSFQLSGFEYMGCPPSPYYNCALNSFHFDRNGLSFNVGSGGSDPEGYVYGYSYFDSNQGWRSERHAMHMVTRDIFLKTADTTFNISAPVPEPETYLMFGLGLLGLAALRRSRK